MKQTIRLTANELTLIRATLQVLDKQVRSIPVDLRADMRRLEKKLEPFETNAYYPLMAYTKVKVKS